MPAQEGCDFTGRKSKTGRRRIVNEYNENYSYSIPSVLLILFSNFMQKTLAAFASIALTFTLAPTVQAHQIWLEQPAGPSAVLNFGEFGENLRETSPGLLDKFGQPRATLVSAKGEQPLEVTKTPTGFALSAKAGQGDSIVAEDAHYPLYKTKQADKEGMGAYHPAARYVTGFAAQQPKLALDIVPTGKAGEFKVFFKGEPLPKAKVGVAVQSGWEKKAESDAQGIVRFDFPWQGNYVIETMHADRTPGERPALVAKGAAASTEKYDSVSYVTSLTVAVADGVAPIAAGPAAPANK
ncbi:MAG: cobalt transporter substrate-binding protein [Variovorax sp.]|nr:cobalt transporter substrate-binding protein [Variovorax sp.]